ncbi:MAG: hypothetical protein KA214_04345 [Neisseriaceae bacterium]|nr:hypothetical protein [Neisseriaceae bacterium]
MSPTQRVKPNEAVERPKATAKAVAPTACNKAYPPHVVVVCPPHNPDHENTPSARLTHLNPPKISVNSLFWGTHLP